MSKPQGVSKKPKRRYARYVVVPIVGRKNPRLWGIKDTLDRYGQIVNTSTDRDAMQAVTDALNGGLWVEEMREAEDS